MARGKKAAQGLTPEEKLAQALVPVEEQPYQIPENWCWTYIKFLFDVTSSKRVHKEDWTNTGIPFYRTRELVKLSEQGYVDNELFITEDLYDKIIADYGKPTAGDVLISGVGTIGVPYVVENSTPFYFKDGNVIWFQNRKKCNAKYIYYLYKSLFMYNQIHGMSSGTTVDTYTIVNANGTMLPLPPLTEQQRIVDRIESIFAKVDEAKEKAQAVVDGFELRKSAILHKAFTGELTAKWREKHGVTLDSWEKETSTKLFSYVTSGSRGWAQYYSDSGSVFIRMGNLDHGTVELDMEDIQYVNLPSKAEGQRSKLQKNDILISITADIGMIGLVRNADQDMYINQHIALARPTEENNAEFIAWYLVSDVGLKQMQSKQRGATKIGLGLDDIRNLKLLMPQVNEQAEIVHILNGLLAKETAAKEAAESVLDQIDTMKKAVLARAFRGELGTNDPTEASAVELLKSML